MEYNVFGDSEWIWHSEKHCNDDYAEFYAPLRYTGGRVVLHLSCDSDYALYINGRFVSGNQYGDFPHYKIYDTLDVSAFLTRGENRIAIVVWYFGVGSQKYYPDSPGLIFTFLQDGKAVLQSNEKILARRSRAYVCGRMKNVSSQLGFSFLYDMNGEDGWKNGELIGFSAAKTVCKQKNLYPRPNEKLRYGKKAEPVFKESRHGGRTFLVDLGKETVGLLSLKVYSETNQRIMVNFGERLSTSNVQRLVGGNDYSVEVLLKKGENEYINPFLRLGCRYLQIVAEEPVEVADLSLIPVFYPVEENKNLPRLSEEEQRIYKLCADTLKLCMLEHFVDCPFREQGLYTYDSRNQMLSRYYAFTGKEYFRYAKSNLLLFAQDRRQDGLLAITAPSNTTLAIPSYSLYYPIAVAEYLKYSGERELEACIMQKMTDIIKVFSDRIEGGLVQNFLEDGYWNFYDWSNGADRIKENTDVFINCLYVLSVAAYTEICRIVQKEPLPCLRTDEVKEHIRTAFYDEEKGLYFVSQNKKTYTQLGNSLAILADCVFPDERERILEKLLSGEAEECSLATKTFLYDAMLCTNKEKYRNVILEEIRKNYGNMLRRGATATWETLEGENAFGGDGSLCHGWSAIALYYLYILKRE